MRRLVSLLLGLLIACPGAATRPRAGTAAALGATLSAPATADTGQAFTATLAVTNTGGVTVNAVTSSAIPACGGTRAPATVAPGATVGFTYTNCSSATAGSLVLSASASGQDAITGATVTSNTATANVDVKVPSPPPSGNTPALVQNVSSATNPLGIGIAGNDFKFTLPNPVLAGNALVLKVAYRASASFAAPPITDDNGNTWPTTPSVSQSDANNNIRLAVFVLPNANAGWTTITIHFTASILPVQYDCGEWRNIATASPLNGSAGASAVASPTISVGTLTPGNNDTNGGNLILYYIHNDDDSGSGNQVSQIAAGGSFTLLAADIAWASQVNSYHASSYYVQTTAAPISPSMTVTSAPGNEHFVALAIALKAANAGTAPGPGIRIVKVHHFTNETPPNPWPVQFPTTGGNLIVANHGSYTAISDNHSNTYTRATTVGHPNMWVSQNATTGTDLKLSISRNAGSAGILRLYEIVGGATSGQPETVAQMDNVNCSSVTSIANAPSITPGSANGLTIALMTIGLGPGLAVTSPSGAHFGLVTYTGETDFDVMENADAEGHIYNTSTATQNWTWTITSISNNSCAAGAIHLKAE